MESMNKFKVLTIVIVCMFLFVIAAIYSNTKDVSNGKAKKTIESSTEHKQKPEVVQSNRNTEDLQRQIDFVNQRIDEISSKSESSYGLNCKIIGVKTSEGILKLSPAEAVEEARNEGSELVITCVL